MYKRARGAGYPNAIQFVTLNQFKGLTDTCWGAASPNIPPGKTQLGCCLRNCYSAADFQQFDMRIAIERAARGAYLIGADDTFTRYVAKPRWGNRYSLPVRGQFRCDTFVIWALNAPLYAVSTAAALRWKNFMNIGIHANGVAPEITFNALKSYR